tara:strand:+ start:32 stop:472 length:441 start_codon:yes stop_codon:yes gene_type:complete
MKHKIIGLTVGVLLAASLSAMADTLNIQDHYREVVYLEPYTVEVCSKQQVSAASQADIANAAFWGAIFGAVVGDVVTDGDGGKLPGAVIGGAIGANNAAAESGTTTATVCKSERRQKSTTASEYSHSTIKFSVDGNMYEVDFIKKQ